MQTVQKILVIFGVFIAGILALATAFAMLIISVLILPVMWWWFNRRLKKNREFFKKQEDESTIAAEYTVVSVSDGHQNTPGTTIAATITDRS